MLSQQYVHASKLCVCICIMQISLHLTNYTLCDLNTTTLFFFQCLFSSTFAHVNLSFLLASLGYGSFFATLEGQQAGLTSSLLTLAPFIQNNEMAYWHGKPTLIVR